MPDRASMLNSSTLRGINPIQTVSIRALPEIDRGDFPAWMIDSLDREARRLGVTRQSIIKVWIADRLQHKAP